MSYDYEIHDDNTKYAVEYIIHKDLPLGFDSLWNDKQDAIERGVITSRELNHCVYITTVRNGKLLSSKIS